MGFPGVNSRTPSGSTSTSRGSSRRDSAAMGSSGGSSMGISFSEWTVKSTRPSRRA